MNVSDIKEEIESLVNKQIMIKVSGSRSRNQIYYMLQTECLPSSPPTYMLEAYLPPLPQCDGIRR